MSGPPKAGELAPVEGARLDREPTFSHRVEFAALRGVTAVLGLLPWARASRFGAALGAIGYRRFGIRKQVVEAQVRAAFPEFSPERVREVAQGAYENLGRISVESALLPKMPPGYVRKLFDDDADGWDELLAAHAQGKGIIFVTGHLGNWELGAAWVASGGITTSAITRHMANPLADRWLTETRTRIGMNVIYDDQAVRRVPRALREGHLVGFVSDQGVKGLASTYVPFFGRPARTPRGAAVLALRMDVPVFFGVVVRQPDGRYRMSVQRVPLARTGDREADVDAVVATWTRMLEDWVRRVPEQYFWHHRRWRRQPPDTPPELREPR